MNRKYLVALGIFVVVGIALFAVLALFVAPGFKYGSQGASSDLDAETMRVAKGLYCPVCPGVPLDVCDTQACEQWRALIKQKLTDGQTEAQIDAYFEQQYGERVLGAPRAEGFNLIVYALPSFAVAAGAALLYLFAQHRTLSITPLAPPDVSLPPSPYRSRIEQELKEND